MWRRDLLYIAGWSLFWILTISGGFLLWRVGIAMDRIIP